MSYHRSLLRSEYPSDGIQACAVEGGWLGSTSGIEDDEQSTKLFVDLRMTELMHD